MKKAIISIFTFLFITLPVLCEHYKEIKNNDVKGFYITQADFLAGKLTLPIDRKHKSDKIKLNQFFISSYISVVEDKSKNEYYKDSLFAIELTNGEKYRFINRNPCLIADTSYLYIYTYNIIKSVLKNSGPRSKFKNVVVTEYFFSYGDHKKTYTLNLSNLHKYVITDSDFHIEVCNKFATDEMLKKIDSKTDRFELNNLILTKLNTYVK